MFLPHTWSVPRVFVNIFVLENSIHHAKSIASYHTLSCFIVCSNRCIEIFDKNNKLRIGYSWNSIIYGISSTKTLYLRVALVTYTLNKPVLHNKFNMQAKMLGVLM